MLVGINGLKGSGKDTVGAYLIEEYGFGRLSFAKKLKESAAALFDLPVDVWDEWKNEPEMVVGIRHSEGVDNYVEITVREFLQRYGTEAHRDIFGFDFWVDHALKGVDPNKNYVFTDARFENELQKIKSLGGYNLQIVRDNIPGGDSHASEIPPPQYLVDYVITNNDGFKELYDQADEFIKFLELESYVYS